MTGSYNLTLQVADMAGEGLTSTATAAIYVEDVNDNPPEFLSEEVGRAAPLPAGEDSAEAVLSPTPCTAPFLGHPRSSTARPGPWHRRWAKSLHGKARFLSPPPPQHHGMKGVTLDWPRRTCEPGLILPCY